jgi:DNA-binding HxlR family transcriptional regulator
MDSDRQALCPKAESVFALLSRKWSGLVLLGLGEGPKCFNELLRVTKGLSARVLSLRLKELEMEGLAARTVLGATPVRVQYSLTEKGAGLSAILKRIAAWAAET